MHFINKEYLNFVKEKEKFVIYIYFYLNILFEYNLNL